MSSPNTSILESFNEKVTLNSDFDNNRCGNTRSQGVLTSIFHDHCNVANEYSNNTPFVYSQNLAKPRISTHSTIDPARSQVDQNLPTNFKSNYFDFASFVHSQNLLQSRGRIHNTIDRASFHVEQDEPTDYNSNSFDKNIFETECQRINLDMDIASRPVPDDHRKINEKFVNFDIDPIPLANDQVSIFEGVTKRKHSLANHSYIDFSGVEDEKVTNSSTFHGEQLEAITTFGAAMHPSHIVAFNDVNPAHKTKSTPQNRITFPTKLMSLLENNPDPSVITWLPHGRAFIVKENTRFMNELSSSLCKSDNFKSFQRMLNMWGFKRLTGKRDKGAYYHQLFLKGRPNLVKKMSICKKKNGVWPLANPAREPDFYQLSKLRPLHIA